ncbi:MAG TPA: A24 family peptidase [Casimicrobiaceae bacterium]|nr:A24 family peptidase [Casimicrobiaceae bacterium]
MIDLLFEPAVATAAAAVIGLLVGSFVNVVIHRLPRMLERGWRAQCAELEGKAPVEMPRYDLVVPRSTCPHCDHRIRAIENIPVISWLALRGRCSACKSPISARYPIVELIAAALGALAISTFGPTWQGVAACGLLWTLLALTFVDLDTQLLPDDLTLPLLWAGLVINSFGLFVPLHEAVIGAVAGYLSLWSVYWAFKLVRGKEGMGYGDFKLLAALGAWLGWKTLPAIVLMSSAVGAIVGLTLMLVQHRDHREPLPFGPYLAVAGAITLFAGGQLVALYLP